MLTFLRSVDTHVSRSGVPPSAAEKGTVPARNVTELVNELVTVVSSYMMFGDGFAVSATFSPMATMNAGFADSMARFTGGAVVTRAVSATFHVDKPGDVSSFSSKM